MPVHCKVGQIPEPGLAPGHKRTAGRFQGSEPNHHLECGSAKGAYQLNSSSSRCRK